MRTGCLRAGLVLMVVWAGGASATQAAPVPTSRPMPAPPNQNDQLEGLLERLSKTGEKLSQAKEPSAIATYSLQQADVVTQIIRVVKPEERDPWIRNLAGCLAAASANSSAQDQSAYQRLANLKQELAKTVPGSALAAHVAMLELQTSYMVRVMAPNADVRQAQEYRQQRLSQYVQEFPQAEETPAALEELAKASADQEAEVKARYRQLIQSFPNHPLAAKARGALRRMELPGQEIDLTLPLLNDPAQPFHVSRVEGQVVVVYCWSSAEPQRCQRNCDTLRHFWEQYGSKGLALVMVNLDNTSAQGRQASQVITLPAVQLYAEGGLEGTWAKNHGVTEVPTLFVVSKDGKVIAQVGDKESLEKELQKQFPQKNRTAKD
jgi:peroxiredoxin